MAMAQLPDPLADLPSIDIKVDTPKVESYEEVMDWIQGRDLQRAINIARDRFRSIPITSADPGWRRINLIYEGDGSVSLLINEINGYLTAISRDNDGLWLKFDDIHTFPGLPEGVRWGNLGIESSYLDLVSEKESLELTVGKHILTNGYHALHRYDATLNPKDRKWRRQRRALAQLIIMFCEASRFLKILHLIIQGNSAADLDPKMLKTVAVLGVHNGDDIAAILRLILRR